MTLSAQLLEREKLIESLQLENKMVKEQLQQQMDDNAVNNPTEREKVGG